MHLDIIGEIEEVETIAVGGKIRDIMRIRKRFGPGRWRKLKGVANIRLQVEGYAKPRSTGTKRTVLVERR